MGAAGLGASRLGAGHQERLPRVGRARPWRARAHDYRDLGHRVMAVGAGASRLMRGFGVSGDRHRGTVPARQRLYGRGRHCGIGARGGCIGQDRVTVRAGTPRSVGRNVSLFDGRSRLSERRCRDHGDDSHRSHRRQHHQSTAQPAPLRRWFLWWLRLWRGRGLARSGLSDRHDRGRSHGCYRRQKPDAAALSGLRHRCLPWCSEWSEHRFSLVC